MISPLEQFSRGSDMPYTQLPWLNFDPMSFLQALDRGTQAGFERTRLDQSAEASRPRGGGVVGGGGFDPLDQARARELTRQTDQSTAESAAENAAWAENNRLISIGVPEQEAFSRAGLGRFTRTPPSPWQTMNLGQGEVVQVNRGTGAQRQIAAGKEKADPVKVEKLRSLRRDLSRIESDLVNPMLKAISGEQLAARKAQTLDDIQALEVELGLAEEVAGAAAPAPPPSTGLPWNSDSGAFQFGSQTNRPRVISVRQK